LQFHNRSTLDTPFLIIAAVLFVFGNCLAAADEPPYGLDKRIPWNSLRLVGSPEPPLAYTVERTYTKHEWKSPIFISQEPGSDRLWIVQSNNKPDQGSSIVRIKDDPASNETEIVLEIPKQLVYSICFDPEYQTNGYVYVFSNGPRDAAERMNRVSRFTITRQPLRINPKSAQLVIEWKSNGHDGGDMAFGLDGMFFITTGDGTSDSDGLDSGQTLNDLLGSVLRIDVHRRDGSLPYAIPKDNPFIDTPGARPEIWAYGLRNPWRMCTDSKTGHIWVGNNGQDLWETAYLLRRGANYGWSVYEGSHPFYLERRRGPTPLVLPTIEHSHAEFRSLTGGAVYYGERLRDLVGAYI
jgi:glucose/arabinose dehydrogenase